MTRHGSSSCSLATHGAYGTARALLIGQILFGAASLLGYLGRALPVLIVARILMAMGGALMVPSAMATIRAYVSERSRPAALGALTMAVGVATAAGPLVGGELGRGEGRVHVEIGWKWQPEFP